MRAAVAEAEPQSFAETLAGARVASVATAFVLLASILLGGGTRAGFLSDTALQLLSLPLLALVIATRHDSAGRWSGAWLFCGLLVLVPLLQIVPLGLHRAVPALAGATGPPRVLTTTSISVSPTATILALLALLVPIAIFLAICRLGWRERRWLSICLLAAAISSAFMGLIQLSQGPDSPLRVFAFTNPDDAVGLFANRNHFAALLYSASVLAAAWAVHSVTALRTAPPKQRYDARVILPFVASLGGLVVLVATQPMTRSRAGLLLAMAALVGCYLIAATDRRRSQSAGFSASRLMAVAIGIGGLLAIQFALYRILDRFEADPLQDARVTFARQTAEAAYAFMPFGAGMGTFVDVYGLYERTADALNGAYANRAHNDLLEVWLESGVFAIGLLAIFAAWFGVRAFAIWRRQTDGFDVDHGLARAATLIVLLLGLHSLVDYPLRTGAMLAVFAVACAFMIPPPPDPNLEDADFLRRPHRRRSKSKPSASPVAIPIMGERAANAAARAPADPTARPAAPADWPDAWRDPPAAGPGGAARPGSTPRDPKWRDPQ